MRLSRLRGFAHVLVRRPSCNRRREHPTHTFVLPPRHARRGWELAYREMLPTDEYIRLSPVVATPIVLTSCDLLESQAQSADGPTSKSNPWGTTSSPTPRGMNDDLASSIYRYPRRIPERFPGPPRFPSCKTAPGPPNPPQVLIRSKQQVSVGLRLGTLSAVARLFERSEWRRPIGWAAGRTCGRAPRGLSSEPTASGSRPTSPLALTIASVVHWTVILLFAEHVPDRFT